MSCSSYCRHYAKGRCLYNGEYYGLTNECPAESLSLLDRGKERGFWTQSELAEYQRMHSRPKDGDEDGGM